MSSILNTPIVDNPRANTLADFDGDIIAFTLAKLPDAEREQLARHVAEEWAEILAAVTNDDFIRGLMTGREVPDGLRPLVCTKPGNPKDGAFLPKPLPCAIDPRLNTFMLPALFRQRTNGEWRAARDDAKLVFAVVLDDVGTKVSYNVVDTLPPSWLIETSRGNFQAGYAFNDYISPDEADTLKARLIEAGLCVPDAKGGAWRWGRLPCGINGKSIHVVNGQPWRCRLIEWRPELRYTVAELVEAFDLPDAPQRAPERSTSLAARTDDFLFANAPKSAATEPHIIEWDNERKNQRAIEALHACDPNCGREEWRNVGWGFLACNVPDGVEILREWSKRSDTYKETDFNNVVRDFDPSKGTGPGTLFHIAERYVGSAPSITTVMTGAMEPIVHDGGPLLKPVSVGDVLTHPSPPPEFVWRAYVPRKEVTLLGAHGGTGKSFIALMLAIAAALGQALFGVPTEQCRVLFVSLEDGAGTVRHRLGAICRAWGIDAAALDGVLMVVDGTDNPELFTADGRGSGGLTAVHAELKTLVESAGVGLVIVDNASDAFGGDEIQRRQVRAFMRALGKMAKDNNAAVLLLAHVDKNSARMRKAEGSEGYSGSTAWHNSARSRLFMTRTAAGTLTLEHQKGNHNIDGLADTLHINWPNGGLPQIQDAGDRIAVQQAQARTDDHLAREVLKLVAEFERLEQYCGSATNARNNIYATLKGQPAFQALKMSRDDVKRVTLHCQLAGWLEPLTYTNVYRKPAQRWTVTGAGRAFAGLAASSASCASSSVVRADNADDAEGALCAPSGGGGYRGCERAQDDAAADAPAAVRALIMGSPQLANSHSSTAS